MPSAATIARSACLTVAYLALAALTVRHTRFNGGVATVWIATALAVSWLSTLDTRRWLVPLGLCWVAGVIVSSLVGVGLVPAPFLAIVNVGEAALIAYLLRRWLGHDRYFESVDAIGAFVAVAGLAVPMLSAFAGAGIVAILTHTPYWSNWLAWSMGHGLGMIVFTPIIQLVVRRDIVPLAREIGARRRIETGVMLAVLAAITYAVFAQVRLPVLFVPLLPMMLLTVRMGRVGAALSIFVLAIVGGVLTLHGTGPVHLVHGSTGLRTQFFQFYLAVSAMVVLPVGALLAQRQSLLNQVSRAEANFRLLADYSGDAVLNLAPDGTIRYASPAVRELAGFDPAEMTGRNARDLVDPADVDRVVATHRHALAHPGESFSVEYRARMSTRDAAWFETRTKAVLGTDDTVTGVVSVIRDVSERKTLERALEQARDHAEQAAQAKSSFLANMSHEIRTPMNGVVGFAELLLADTLSDRQRRRAEMIADSARAMMRLLNDILDISKIEAGQIELHEEAFNLPHALRACINLVSPAAAQKGLALAIDIAPDVPRVVTGDGMRLRQILLNLLGNATKFTATGSITLRASRVADGPADRLRFDVIDTGVGIAPEAQAAIFAPFVQADASVASRFGGTGLGLAISTQLVRLMGGEIALESAVGSGTQLTITLPLPEAEEGAVARSMPGKHDAAIASRPLNVLVAEDHDINQLLIAQMLDTLGHRATVVADGEAAIAAIDTAAQAGADYDIVLMDMQMPVLDGLAATRAIRARGIDAAALPIVALTANAYAEDVAACREAGMQAHLAKPLTLDMLAGTLAELTGGRAEAPALVAPHPNTKLQRAYHARRDAALALLADADPAEINDDALAAMIDALHKLAGTAGMFGEAALGDAAAALQHALEHAAPADRSTVLVEGLSALRAAA